MSRVKQLFKKEFLQLSRDRRSLVFFTFIPLFLLIIFGYALSSDIKHIPTAVYDTDGHFLSRELQEILINSEYFDIKFQANSENEIKYLLDKGVVKAGLIIPPDFSRKVIAQKGAQLQIIIDGSEPNSASTALNVSAACVNYFTQKIFPGVTPQIVEIKPRIWYNPELRSANFMIPGLIGLVFQMLIPMMTVVSIVKEREKGTIEQLITTPIKTWELVLGKLLPYVVIAILVVTFVTISGLLIFRVSMKGNFFIFALFNFMYLLLCLSLGFLFSILAQNQLQAFQLVLFLGLPSILLSGLIFPREAMPKIIYYLGNLLPLTYFIKIIRSVFLKGVGLKYLWDSALALLFYESLIIFIIIKRFKKRLN